jgi:hypothetical protein
MVDERCASYLPECIKFGTKFKEMRKISYEENRRQKRQRGLICEAAEIEMQQTDSNHLLLSVGSFPK